MSSLTDKLEKKGPKRVLSLDGGGIRGILSIAFLEKIEAILQKQHKDPNLRLCDYFDLIGGTSTGSILATGLALGMSAAELREYYMKLGPNIFGKKKSLLNYVSKGEKYDKKPLTEALKDVFGDIKLGDQEKIKTGLAIITKRADTSSTWPFINHPDSKFYEENKDIPLWQIVRASAAAPTYFLPITLKVGKEESGTFIDGGISMANNPSFTLLMIATLRGFPYHWPMGPEKLLMVSLGTGSAHTKFNTKDVAQKNLLAWAGMLPEYFMADATYYNQIIMQILSDSPTAKMIDEEIGDLKYDSLNGNHALSYLRYDALYEKDFLEDLDMNLTSKEIKALSAMDNHKNTEVLYEIGKRAAEKQIESGHFIKKFGLDAVSDEGLMRFTQNKKYKLDFENYVKKPVIVRAAQIDEPFEVETLEGIMRGKPGDFLMKGIDGEMYVCDKSLFKRTYNKKD